MEASAVLAQPALRQQAEARAMRGREQFELQDRAWPTHPLANGDPSLMIGEAGIGYFYLRMADAAVPSLLAVNPQARRRRQGERDGYVRLRDENLEGMFGQSLDLFTAHPTARARILHGIYGAARTLPLHDAAMRVLTSLQLERGAGSATAAQSRALHRDYARAELLELPNDTSERTHVAGVGLTQRDVPWSTVTAHLASSVRIVDAPPGATDHAGLGCAKELLMRRHRTIRSVPLSSLAAIVLSACADEPTTVDQVMRILSESTTVTDAVRLHLIEAVQHLLLSAWRSDVVLLWREA